jgi:molybdenum cofactor cytidylyltransferase
MICERVGAVIVAAGLSRRMGDFKPMLPLGQSSVIRNIINTFQQVGVHPIVVVTGYRGTMLAMHISDLNVDVVHNADYYKSDMFVSAKLGFRHLVTKCDRVFFTPVDIPLFTEKTLQELMNLQNQIICPRMHGKKGHPILLRQSVVRNILAYQGSMGLKGALAHYGYKVEQIDVHDEGILFDMDTIEQYQYILQMYRSRH